MTPPSVGYARELAGRDDLVRLGDLMRRHGWSLSHCLDEIERKLLLQALRETDGNQTSAARLLGVSPRTIYNKLSKHGLRSEGQDSSQTRG